MARQAEISRITRETEVRVSLELDGSGQADIDTGVPFLDHMLHHVALHGLFDLTVHARGDVEVDDHHTVEDVGIVLGQTLAQAVGERTGLTRYGSQLLPMDEALALVAVDVSGRSVLVYEAELPAAKVGTFDTELVHEFLRALSQHAGLTLHVRVLSGANTHHIIEAIFKALGRALGQAVTLDARRADVPSTKGVL
ncbi:MAG: imidazoleglycerol-phosphate dehydratase HisB [Anaerolineales bacterium]